MGQQPINDLQDGQIIQYRITRTNSFMYASKSRDVSLGYVRSVDLDGKGNTRGAEILEILPLGASEEIQSTLLELTEDDVGFRQFDGKDLGLENIHVAQDGKRNQWAIIDAPRTLNREDFVSPGATFELLGQAYDDLHETIKNPLVSTNDSNPSGRGYTAASFRAWDMSHGNAVTGEGVVGRDRHNLPDDVVEKLGARGSGRVRQNKRLGKIGGGEARDFDVPLALLPESLGLPATLTELFTNPHSNRLRTVPTLQKLFMIAEKNPDGFAKYIPNDVLTIEEAVAPYLKGNNKSMKNYAGIAQMFSDEEVMGDEAITDFEYLLSLIHDAKNDDDIMEFLAEFTDNRRQTNGLIAFIKRVESDLNSGVHPQAEKFDPDRAEKAAEQVREARKKFMSDHEKWDGEGYAYGGEETANVTLLDREPRKKALKNAFNDGEGNRTIKPGQSVVIQVPTTFYDYM